MENMLELSVGKKLPEDFGIKAIAEFPGNQAQYVVCLGPGVFLLVAQSDWSKKEQNSLAGDINIYCAEIDDVIEFLVKTESLLLELPYDISKTHPNIEFKELEEGEGLAFHIVMCSQDTTILSMRLVSLQRSNSNAIIKTLQDIKHLSAEDYKKQYERICQDFSIEEVMANAFIHERFSGR